jgi:ectoine hydroxylase-related dioxygenase (phytanoyl-CoA dioxygenase family)
MPPTQYYNRYIPLIRVPIESQNSMNSEGIAIPMVPGDLILFPSDIMHSVNINVSNETRYSLSFNTFSNELGSNETLSYASWETNVND